MTLPPKHAPLDVTCSYPAGAEEVRYWQKNQSDDGVFPAQVKPGQAVPPSCDKTAFPARPPVDVTCTLYPGFMLKEMHSQGDEGENTSIVPVKAGQAEPACNDRSAPGEVLLSNGGYFWGAVNGYVFLGVPDADPVVGYETDIFGADGQGGITTIYVLDAPYVRDAPPNRLTRVPGGFDLHFMTDQTLNCSVGGSNGAACFARLEQASGAKIQMAQCVKAEPENDPNSPVWIQYPALLNVRGSNAVLRATGPATRCINTPY